MNIQGQAKFGFCGVIAATLLIFGPIASAAEAERSPSPSAAGAVRFDPHILVDQFGYRPADPKVAVIRNPQVGYDHADQIAPGPRYEVRRAEDGAVLCLPPLHPGTEDPQRLRRGMLAGGLIFPVSISREFTSFTTPAEMCVPQHLG